MNKESQNYRDTLINAHKNGELSTADFIDTLDHYTKLIQPPPNIRADQQTKREKTNGNDPVTVSEYQGGQYGVGLTKRELMAVMALQGLLSATDSEGNWTGINADAAKEAVKATDELINELNKQP